MFTNIESQQVGLELTNFSQIIQNSRLIYMRNFLIWFDLPQAENRGFPELKKKLTISIWKNAVKGNFVYSFTVTKLCLCPERKQSSKNFRSKTHPAVLIKKCQAQQSRLWKCCGL